MNYGQRTKIQRQRMVERASEIIRAAGGRVVTHEHADDIYVGAKFEEVEFSFDVDRRRLYQGLLVHWHGAKRNLDAHNDLFDSVNQCHWRKGTAHIDEGEAFFHYLERASAAAAAGTIFQ